MPCPGCHAIDQPTHRAWPRLRRDGWYLAALFGCVLVAILIRYRYWVLNGGLEPDFVEWNKNGITPGYIATAQALLQGRWSGISRSYPPAYGALIALLNVLGVTDIQSFRLVQIVLDALGCILMYRACRGLGCRKGAALIGALAYATLPLLALGSTWVLAEAIVPLLMLVILTLVLRARRTGRPRDWAWAGVAGSLAALTRAELGVLFVPLSVCAFFWAARRCRRTAVLATLAGFWIPWLLVASMNFVTFGRFAVASNVTFYVLFSGLGQVTNTYGYYADDPRADKELKALGLQYHSPEAEAHWKRVYLDAWRQHPAHVLSTIAFRVKRIFLETELGPGWLARIGLGFTVCALLILVARRRVFESMIVAGPLLVAMGSLGFIYVELRYVRYAHVSYLLGLAVLLGFGAAWFERIATRFVPTEYRERGARWSRVVVVVALLALLAPSVFRLDDAARGQVVAQALISGIPAGSGESHWRRVETIEPGARGAIVEKLPDGTFRIITSPEEKGYQGLGRVPAEAVAALLVDYKVDVSGGVGYVGILRGDGSRFYTQTLIPADQTSTGRIRVGVDDPFVYVVFTGISDGSTFHVRELRYLRICVAPVFGLGEWLLWSMFPHPDSFPNPGVRKCPETRSRGVPSGG
jgi:4-amino-4-deoxy-L-arabinose transferase-like glycosyltransferase